MTLRVMQLLLPSDDDGINGFGTLVPPVCRNKSPYVTTVLTQVFRVWCCCHSPTSITPTAQYYSLILQECYLTHYKWRKKTVLIRNIGRVPPPLHSYHSTLLSTLKLVVRSVQSAPLLILSDMSVTTLVSRSGYSWRLIQCFSVSLPSNVFCASLFFPSTLPVIPDILLTRWSKKCRCSQSNVAHPSWSVIF
jgi:hypothetical protein